jgi:hypothetical protein
MPVYHEPNFPIPPIGALPELEPGFEVDQVLAQEPSDLTLHTWCSAFFGETAAHAGFSRRTDLFGGVIYTLRCPGFRDYFLYLPSASLLNTPVGLLNTQQQATQHGALLPGIYPSLPSIPIPTAAEIQEMLNPETPEQKVARLNKAIKALEAEKNMFTKQDSSVPLTDNPTATPKRRFTFEKDK